MSVDQVKVSQCGCGALWWLNAGFGFWGTHDSRKAWLCRAGRQRDVANLIRKGQSCVASMHLGWMPVCSRLGALVGGGRREVKYRTVLSGNP